MIKRIIHKIGFHFWVWTAIGYDDIYKTCEICKKKIEF